MVVTSVSIDSQMVRIYRCQRTCLLNVSQFTGSEERGKMLEVPHKKLTLPQSSPWYLALENLALKLRKEISTLIASDLNGRHINSISTKCSAFWTTLLSPLCCRMCGDSSCKPQSMKQPRQHMCLEEGGLDPTLVSTCKLGRKGPV